MDTITILRELWHRRLLVVAVTVLAVAVGIALTLSAHPHRVGVASARLLVDTPRSQVIDVAPKGSDQLGGQAVLLAGLMVDGPIKATIARDARLRPDQILGTSQLLAGAASPTPGAQAPPYRLSTQVLSAGVGAALPIIEIDAQAPTPAGAARLAQAAVTGVQSYESSVASAEKVSVHHRLRLDSLGVTQATVQTTGGSKLPGALAALAILLLGCGGIVSISALLRRARREPSPAAARRESARELDGDEGLDPSRRVLDLPQRSLGDGAPGTRDQRSRELIVVRSDPSGERAANGGDR